MATKIRLKKSGATGNTPTTSELEFGELALNYADGVLYYKDAANTIQQISGAVSNTFETINANGTLLIPDSNTDILSIIAGDGIDITANGLSDTLTINVRFDDTVTSNSILEAATANAVKTAYDLANTANTTAGLAYDAANNAAVKVTANSGVAFSANTLSFNNTATVTVTVTQDGANANISFDAAPQVIVDDTFTAQGNTTAAATANIANGLYSLVTSAANTVRVSQNGSSTLSSKQLNFVNTSTVTVTVSDSGDGNANVTFTSSSGGEGVILTDLFTGTGSCTQFGLSQSSDPEHTLVFLNGVAQKPYVDYSVSGFVLTMNTAPVSNSKIEARTLEKVSLIELRQSRVNSDVFSGNGACTEFTLSQTSSTDKTLVYIDGVCQVPVTDYNIISDKINFINAPLNGTVIEVRSFTEFNVANSSTIKSTIANGDGSNTQFTLASNSSTLGTFVFVDGVVQVPTTDYTVSNNIITFTNPPEANAVIELRTISDVNFVSPRETISNTSSTLTATDTGLNYVNGSFANTGDAIHRTYILRGTTSGNTETEIFLNGNLRIPVYANTTMFYTADIVARRIDDNLAVESAGFYVKGVADNLNNTTSDVGNLYEVVVAEDDVNLAVDVRANNSTDSINIYVTGIAGKDFRWTALVKTVEVGS